MRPIPPPAGVELEDLELYAAGVNRALQDVPDLQYATIGGQELELTDLDGAIQAIAVTGQHDQLQGVDVSVAHLLFLLLDGSRPMTGDLDMAENDILDIGSLKSDLVIIASTYNFEHVPISGLGGHPTIKWEWTKAGYTATGYLSPNYRTVEAVAQHIWTMGDGLYVYDSGGGTGNIYATGQVQALHGGAGGPFVCPNSSNLCTNLNADLLDGYHGAEFAALAENELITGDWTFGGSAKAYFNDASALGGTEYITSGADTYLDLHWADADSGCRFYSGANEMLKIRRISGANSAYTRLYSPLSFDMFVAGVEKFRIRETFIYAYVSLNISGGYLRLLGDYAPADGSYSLVLGAGSDVRIAYDGTNLQIFPAFIGTGYVNIFKATDAQSVAMLTLEGDRATMGDDDEIYQSWKLSNDAGEQTEFGRYSVVAEDVSDGTEDGAFTWDVMVDGVLTEMFSIGSDGAGFVGGIRVEQTTISAATTLTSAHYIVLCDTDTAGAPFTVTLPAAASHTDRVYVIVNEGTSGHDVTVDGNGAEEINHAATQIVGDGASMRIVCDGTAWWVL